MSIKGGFKVNPIYFKISTETTFKRPLGKDGIQLEGVHRVVNIDVPWESGDRNRISVSETAIDDIISVLEEAKVALGLIHEGKLVE